MPISSTCKKENDPNSKQSTDLLDFDSIVFNKYLLWNDFCLLRSTVHISQVYICTVANCSDVYVVYYSILKNMLSHKIAKS